MSVPAGVDRVCINCHKVVAKDRERLCNHCGLPFAPPVDPYPALVEGNPATIVRVYRGQQQKDTNIPFTKDAAQLARFGYVPTTQSWSPGQWGGGAFLLAVLLCIVLVGILVFIYLLIVKPEGTLTVTFSRSLDVPSLETADQADLTSLLQQLESARGSGLLTQAEYEHKREEVLRRF